MSAFAHETRSRTERYTGPIFSVFTDEVTMSGGGTAHRDVVVNKNAVGVVALDEVGRVVLIKQYRHPVGEKLWELPAGLRDVAGEDLVVTAGRELAEEADITARRFDLLVDLHTSPGFSAETIRIFLARELTPVPEEERHARKDEEADIEICWVDLDEAVAMVLRGEITNAAAVGGLLSAARARDDGWATLRPAGASPLR
ncbi:NUDIX domain-containing protein [Couchioplanes caeruleus]|uniref:ADP-ribose pyrophosphatase n=2 Tax=Couchioplanes caeruleus TaxID=56438 RepID=A0A1K0G7E2_9ACTN|nr:NUDIX hydrolase [Couchioplanes caeruleus]OJF13170.1 ADP-ribose pyrophosphatase [Couchioplanes caeruleus subsp. caeruleus]ROP33390.1 ADP-ribose pyrophosphatase [Couchioplanes caeruleus]